MTPYLSCQRAWEMLEPFVDGELPMGDQVSVESHLRWCRTCSARVEDLQLIASSLRLTPAAAELADRTRADEARALASIQAEVLARIRAERDLSLRARIPELFADMRLLWPALGATVAVLLCIWGAGGVLYLTTVGRPDSLAAMIESVARQAALLRESARPGSDGNPLQLDDHDRRISIPRALNDGGILDRIADEEAEFALATVVTREGRISDYELLNAERASVAVLQATRANGADVVPMLDAVRQSRFAPAQTPGGGTVAVNMIWLIARTTVRGSAPALTLDLPTRAQPPPSDAARPPALDHQSSGRKVIAGRSRTA